MFLSYKKPPTFNSERQRLLLSVTCLGTMLAVPAWVQAQDGASEGFQDLGTIVLNAEGAFDVFEEERTIVTVDSE